MVDAGAEKKTLELTPTWVVAGVCCVIVLISFLVHRFLQCAGQLLSRPKKDCRSPHRGRRKYLFDALQKIKEELMLLGFISLLLSVFQTRIGKICISKTLAKVWLPCHQNASSSSTTPAHFSTNPIPSDGCRGRRLLEDTTDYCSEKGKVPLLSLTALHHLHIFIFVLATFHVIVSVVIILCGEARLHYWREWEQCIIKDEHFINEEERCRVLDRLAKKDGSKRFAVFGGLERCRVLDRLAKKDGSKRFAVFRGLHMIGKHFSPSLTKLEYIAIRLNCIKARYLEKPEDHFQKYIIHGVQKDFHKVIGISWYLWLFVVVFLLLNVAGRNAYFWISFLPLTLLLAVGMKLEHIVKQRTDKIIAKYHKSEVAAIEFSDEDFWFQRPHLVLDLIHIILFQNSFELAFFFFILFQYGFHSCIMGKVGYVIPRLVIGVFVQIMCSYRTLPLYAIIKKQMQLKPIGSKKEKEMKIVTFIWDRIDKWDKRKATENGSTQGGSRNGLVANEQTKAGHIEPEEKADIEAPDGTKPEST